MNEDYYIGDVEAEKIRRAQEDIIITCIIGLVACIVFILLV